MNNRQKNFQLRILDYVDKNPRCSELEIWQGLGLGDHYRDNPHAVHDFQKAFVHLIYHQGIELGVFYEPKQRKNHEW